MGLCIACFDRDIVGSIGLHNAKAVQYLRPEIMGIVLGSFFTSIILGEFKPRGGSSSITRFFLGFFLVIGALVFLGCPTRDIIRIAGGDLNAVVALFGLISGILIGLAFIKRGFNLGRSKAINHFNGFLMPICMLLLLIMAIFKPSFLNFSIKGPGSMYAPIFYSMIAGLIIGYIGQKSRLCFAGAWRDIFLVKDFYLFSGVFSFFIGVIWNFLSLSLVGLCATLLGGCPFRQTILSGEGDTDAAITLLGMFLGTAISHNFLLASSGNGVSLFGPTAVIIGMLFCIIIGFLFLEK